MTELKPCPFCGSTDVYLIEGFAVCCRTCCAYGPQIDINNLLIDAWNRRMEEHND